MNNLIRNTARCYGYCFKFAPFVTVLLMLTAATMAALPYLAADYTGQIVDALVGVSAGTAAISIVWALLGAYATVRLVRPTLSVFAQYLDRRFFMIFEREVEIDILRRRAAIDIAHYENPEYLNRLNRAFTKGFWPIVNIADRNNMFIRIITSIVIGSAIAAAFDWRIYALILICSAPSFYVNFKYGKTIWGIYGENSDARRRYENIKGHISSRYSIIELKMFQGVERMLGELRSLLADFFMRRQGAETKRTLLTVGSEIISTLGSVAAIVLIVRQVLAGEVEVGAMTFLIAALTTMNASISEFFTVLSYQLDDNRHVNDIFETLDEKPIVKEHEDALALASLKAPDIVFDNVSFRYAGQDKDILKNVNLRIPSGTKMGLVGNNGAGKTTLIRLLCRIHDPTEGRILIDGIDLRHIKVEDWRATIGVLFQDFTSYSFLVKDSIAMGRSSEPVDIDRVRAAADVSESKQFIEGWGKQYDEQIGVDFGGVDPSKGQKQKLALARAIYRQAPVLILDEPTAAVDAESEALIFEKIEALPDDVTALLISHRFSTVKRADTIVVMENGTVHEQGTHEELMAKGGRYAELFTTQLEGYTK